MRHISLLVVGMFLAAFSQGCAHKYVEKVAVFDRNASPDQGELIKTARRDGMYRVQVVSGDRFIKSPLYMADRWVQKGDELGFRQEEDGTVVAIAGEQEIELGVLPANATHVMWFHKSKKPTQFAKSMGKGLEALGQVATVTVVGGLVVGAVALDLYDDCDDSSYSAPKHHGRNLHK